MFTVSIRYFRSLSGLQDWRHVFKIFYELLIEQSPSHNDMLIFNDVFALSLFAGFVCLFCCWVFFLFTVMFRIPFIKLILKTAHLYKCHVKNFTLNLSQCVLFKLITSYFLDDLLRAKVLEMYFFRSTILGYRAMQILIWCNSSVSFTECG